LSTATGREGTRQFTFEPTGRVLGKGSYPQLGVRASGDLFLLRLKERNLWLQTSSDGGDSFDEGLRVNDGEEVASHAENTPLMVVRSMREFYALWTSPDASTIVFRTGPRSSAVTLSTMPRFKSQTTCNYSVPVRLLATSMRRRN
jgi:hypothetical protein